MSTMSRAEYKSAILAAAESGALEEALEYYHLTRLAIFFVRDSYTGRRTFSITADDHHDLMGVYERLNIEPPVKFRYSEARRDYTFTAGVGYDFIDMELLGGDASGAVHSAFKKAGMRISR